MVECRRPVALSRVCTAQPRRSPGLGRSLRGTAGDRRGLQGAAVSEDAAKESQASPERRGRRLRPRPRKNGRRRVSVQHRARRSFAVYPRPKYFATRGRFDGTQKNAWRLYAFASASKASAGTARAQLCRRVLSFGFPNQNVNVQHGPSLVGLAPRGRPGPFSDDCTLPKKEEKKRKRLRMSPTRPGVPAVPNRLPRTSIRSRECEN